MTAAGLGSLPELDLSWLDADTDGYGLTPPFAILVAGGSAHRPEKRWPAERFAALAGRLLTQGITPVLVGTAAEGPAVEMIAAACPGCRDLSGATDLRQLAGLGRRAVAAVGNDTGPMHLVLFSAASDPNRSQPIGRSVSILRRDSLNTLPVDAVFQALSGRLLGRQGA